MYLSHQIEEGKTKVTCCRRIAALRHFYSYLVKTNYVKINPFLLVNSPKKEIRYPDGHYDMVYPEEADERLNEWHAAHPEWVMTPYGTWTNEEENKKFRETLGLEETK